MKELAAVAEQEQLVEAGKRLGRGRLQRRDDRAARHVRPVRDEAHDVGGRGGVKAISHLVQAEHARAREQRLAERDALLLAAADAARLRVADNDALALSRVVLGDRDQGGARGGRETLNAFAGSG